MDVNSTFICDASGMRSALDNPNISLTDPKTWEAVFSDSFSSHSGITVNAEKSFGLGAVYQAIWKISGDTAKLSIAQYESAPDAKSVRRPLPNDPLTYLVATKPNREMNAFKFWRRVMIHALMWSNAWFYIDRNLRGQPIELVPLLPDRTGFERVDGKLWVVTEANGRLEPIDPENVFHIEGLCWDNLEAPTLIQVARNSWSLGLAQEQFASKFFKNGGRIGGVLELPAAMPKPAQQTIEEGFRKTYESGDNPFLTVILRENAKFHAGQFSPHDAQLVDAKEQHVREVARWFNLAPSKLGLSDSVSYNSKSEDNQDYLDSTLSIWLEQIEAELDAKLLPAGSTRYFEFDTSTLLRMNERQRFETYEIGIRSRIINPNEARLRENREPYEGGDEFVNPNTMKDGTPSDKNAQETPKKQAKNDIPKRTGLARVIYHIGSHARHRAKSGGKSFLAWIDGGLTSHREESRTIVGNDEIVVSILADLADVANTKTEADLCFAVDSVMEKYEQQPFVEA